MRERDIDALVICENGRSRYLTGYQRYFTATHVPSVHAVVLTQADGPFLLLPRHIRLERDAHFATQLVTLDFGEPAKWRTLSDLLRETRTATGRIAIETNFLSQRSVDGLKEIIKGELVAAEPLMQRATAIKFPDEIALLRESARLVDIGVAAAVDACRVGVTELDVAAEATEAMLRGGAEFINHMTVRSGPHADGNHPFPTDRRLSDGDCVQIDIGCVYRGYVSDTNRTKIVGTPSGEQRKLLDVGQSMLEAGIAAVAPGVAASSIWRAAVDVAERAGMRDLMAIPFVGHGIGLSLHELPFIDAAATTILEENMVFALEPGVYAPGIGCSRPEDMILVTTRGAERLTHFPRDADLNFRSAVRSA